MRQSSADAAVSAPSTSSPPSTCKEITAPLLSISPVLREASAWGWRDIASLLWQTEASERARLEREEQQIASSLLAVEQLRRAHAERAAEDARMLTSRSPSAHENGESAVSQRMVKEGEEEKMEASHSPRQHSEASEDGLAGESTAAPLTEYQRFCFTKSTAAKYQAASTAQSRPEPSKRKAAQSRSVPHRVSASKGLHPTPPAQCWAAQNVVSAAPLSSPRNSRDTWAWSHSRQRGTAAPAATPTVSRTYGSAEQRTVMMGLLFDRLSYEGKALVARQAESLGLLAASADDVAESALLRQRSTSSSSSPSRTPMEVSEATVLMDPHVNLATGLSPVPEKPPL